MSKLLIDGDIIPYEIGFAMQKDGVVADWHAVRTGIQNRFSQILEGAQEHVSSPIDSVEVWLSDPDNTFRKDVATILPYKGNRTREKPYHWDGIRAYLRDNEDAGHMVNLEGDDALLIRNAELRETGEEVIVASSDKDLLQVPILKYAWARGNVPAKFNEVSLPLVGYRNLWQQMLVGDRTDNILGLFGIGEKATAVKKLFSMNSEMDMAEYVFEEYSRRFGNYAYRFFSENFSLLKLIDQREGAEDPVHWQTDYLEGVFDASA